MTALPSFTVTGTVFDLLGNISGGDIVGNGLIGNNSPATVTFTPNVPLNEFITWDDALYRVDPVVAAVNSDGSITRNGDPVQLLANDSGLSITGLQWQVSVSSMQPFWFNAPTNGGSIDLSTVTPAAAVSIEALSPTTFGEELITAANAAAVISLLGLGGGQDTYLGTSANQTAMLAQTGVEGNWTIRTDTTPNTVWYLTGSPASTLGSWTELPTVLVVNNSDGTVSVAGVVVGEPLTAQTANITASTAPSIGQINVYDATSGALTPTLNALSTYNVGASMIVQKYTGDSSTNTITLTCHSGDTFDNASTTRTLKLSGEFEELQVISVSGTKKWKVISDGKTLGSLDGRYIQSSTVTTKGDLIVGTGAGTVTRVPSTIYYADAYGASPSNSASVNNTAIAAAITAMGTSPGTLKFGTGAYTYSSTITLNNQPGQNLAGDGSGLTVLNFTGTGDAVRIYDKNAPTPLHPVASAYGGCARGGHVTGLTIYGGNNSNTNINGLHIGDVYAIYISDVDIQSFNTTGSIGFFGEQVLGGASERCFIQMSVEDCTTCYSFARNASNPHTVVSWSYSKFFLAFLAHNNQNGVLITDGVHMDEVDMWIGGNTEVGNTGSTNTGVVLTFGTTNGFAIRFGGYLNVCVENNNDYGSGGPTHADINVLTGGSPTIEAMGVLQFNDAGGGAYTAGSVTASVFKFSGRINCPSLGQNPTQFSTTQGFLINSVPVATRSTPTSITSSATPTPAITAQFTQYDVTALAAGATFGAPTGSPADGYKMVVRINDNGSAQTLAYNSIYHAVGVTLPTTTIVGQTIYLGMIYNSATSKWDVVAVGQG